MVSLRQRSVIFATFLVAFCGLGLLAGGLGTRYWVVAQAEKETSDKASGFIHFGLFEGTKRLDHGWGERSVPMDIVEILYRERTFMVKELWVGTIVFICVAMLFGIIAAFAAIINTAHNPVEPICHIPGMIGWNVIAALSSLASLVTWIVQYAVKLRSNVMVREDREEGGWSSSGKANIGHSFWLVVVAFAMFCLNVTILHFLLKKRVRTQSSKRAIVEATTKPNGNLMLY